MRNALFGFRGVGLFVVTLASACTGSDPGGGGAGGTGGAGPSCPDVAPCGGSVVGTWTVSPSSCLALAGDLDGWYLSLGCPKVPVTGTLTTTGTFTANADGTYTDNTTTTKTTNETAHFLPPRWMSKVEKREFARVIEARNSAGNPVLAAEFDLLCDYIAARSRVTLLRRMAKAAVADCKDYDGIKPFGYSPDQRHAVVMLRQCDATASLCRRLARLLRIGKH